MTRTRDDGTRRFRGASVRRAQEREDLLEIRRVHVRRRVRVDGERLRRDVRVGRAHVRLVLKVQADSQVVNNVCPHPSLPMVVTSGIDDCMRVWEGGDERHLIDLPERYPDDDDDDDFDDDDYDDLDEMDAWGVDGEYQPGVVAYASDAEISSSDDEDEENESDHVHDPEEEDGEEEEKAEPFGAFARAEAVGSESDERRSGSPGTTSARAPSRARRNRGRSPDAARVTCNDVVTKNLITMTMRRTPPRLVRRLAVEDVFGFQQQPPRVQPPDFRNLVVLVQTRHLHRDDRHDAHDDDEE